MERLKNLCETAIKYGASFGKKLDYSDKSVDELEKILEIYHVEFKASDSSDEEIKHAALIFGAYVGETMLKNGFDKKGYNWDISDDGTPFIKGKRFMYPVDKVFRRLKYGAEDSISLFYDESFVKD